MFTNKYIVSCIIILSISSIIQSAETRNQCNDRCFYNHIKCCDNYANEQKAQAEHKDCAGWCYEEAVECRRLCNKKINNLSFLVEDD